MSFTGYNLTFLSDASCEITRAVPNVAHLQSFTTLILRDGEVFLAAEGMRALSPVPLASWPTRLSQPISYCQGRSLVEAWLRANPGEPHALGYLQAFSKTRKRPGKAGIAPMVWAEYARQRVAAGDAAPRGATLLLGEWWGLSQSAVTARVNKVIKHGMLEGVRGNRQLSPLAIELLAGPRP